MPPGDGNAVITVSYLMVLFIDIATTCACFGGTLWNRCNTYSQKNTHNNILRVTWFYDLTANDCLQEWWQVWWFSNDKTAWQVAVTWQSEHWDSSGRQ